MPHPLVTQLWFARSEFMRCLEGVTPEEAKQRITPMNSLSWIVGHMAGHEHLLWVIVAQNQKIDSDLFKQTGYGQPACTPDWTEALKVWQEVTLKADIYLESLTNEALNTFFEWKGKKDTENVGINILRNTYHYWFHMGEAHSIRQMLGHKDLPQFVGDMSSVKV